MRLNIAGTALALLACPLAATAAAVVNATAAIKATSPLPIGQWYDIRWDYIAPGVVLGCELKVEWSDWWEEAAQGRYQVMGQATVGKIKDILDLDQDQEPEYEKLLLEAWIHFWWEESTFHEHPGDNFQHWLEWRPKSRRWTSYADQSHYKLHDGWKEYVAHNVNASKRWQNWTLGRCTVDKDF